MLTFSLGFGPKLLKVRGRETEYCISLLPFGGYVKMLEESKNDLVMPEDSGRTFESLPAYKRVIVVLAGPMMNLLFPLLLYVAVFITDGPFQPPTVGVVLPEHPADGLLIPGDRIMEIDGESIGTFSDVKRIVEKSPGESLEFKVFRNNQHEHVDVLVQEHRRELEFDLEERYGSIGIQPNAPAPVVGIQSPTSPAYRAGLRTFDVITFVEGRPIDRFMDLERELKNNRGVTVPVTYLRPRRLLGAMGGLFDMAVFEAGVVSLTPNPKGESLSERTGIELADLYVMSVPPDSSLARVGVEAGDRLVELDGQRLPAWSTFVDRLAAQPDEQHQLDYISARSGRLNSVSFRLRREIIKPGSAQRYSRAVLPCGSWANLVAAGQLSCPADSIQQWLPLSLEEKVNHPAPLHYAISRAVESSFRVTQFIAVALYRVVQGKVSLQEMSGPIAIYEIAGREGRKGPDYFIWVMAVISINLGLLNLLPIPVLDGGHLFFILVEAVIRRPLPLRVREVAHIIGMAFLLFLMAVAFKNDLTSRFQKQDMSDLITREN